MKSILQIFTLKLGFILTVVVLVLLVIFNFYGPYTSQFYFFKPVNYIFPILTVGHFIFLYVLWFKIKEDEMTDPQMRNLEYVLYVIFLVYVYKAFESIYVLTTYGDYENHVIPGAFLPLGILILVLHLLLVGLTLLMFKYRKDRVGEYKFDDMNHVDSWE
jgi:hypothetical protein